LKITSFGFVILSVAKNLRFGDRDPSLPFGVTYQQAEKNLGYFIYSVLKSKEKLL